MGMGQGEGLDRRVKLEVLQCGDSVSRELTDREREGLWSRGRRGRGRCGGEVPEEVCESRPVPQIG